MAGVLKLYLREMPEPLFKFDYYDDYLRIARTCGSCVLKSIDLPSLLSCFFRLLRCGGKHLAPHHQYYAIAFWVSWSHCEAGEHSYDPDKLVEGLRGIVQQLPNENYSLAVYLLHFLRVRGIVVCEKSHLVTACL